MKNLKLIKKLEWSEVFDIWRQDEENLEHWKKYWRSKGFKSWADWRMEQVRTTNADKMKWKLYEVIDPIKTVPTFKGGPTTTWIKYYYAPLGKSAKNLPTFAELTANPTIGNHYYILDLIKTFPKKTTIMAVKTKQGVVVVQGMHRACAIALSVALNRPVKTKVKVALAEIKGNLKIKRKKANS